jgi:hypothetical protein
MSKEQEQVEVKLSEKYKLIIDCPPGDPRPDHYLPRALEGTGLVEEDFEKVSTLFGAWTWKVKKEKEELYAKAKPKLRENCTHLYENTRVRYIEW